MSREIKFRVWDQKDKKYLLPEKQGFVILPTMPSFGVTLPYENCSNPGNIDEDCVDWADADLLMGRYELEQYTGLKDKNGKEIYEGDIVKARDWDGDWGKYRIKWKQSHCAFEAFECRKHGKWNWTLQGFGGIEVIGNIHENPELIGGTE